MRDFLVYHNPDSMRTSVMNVPALAIVTDKTAGNATGDRVWLMTGEGAPRTFFLRSYFIVDQMDSGNGFKTRLSGAVGKAFDPMIELNGEEWFRDFKKRLGNFAWGLQRIKDVRFIRGLEVVAAGR
jgi:hypothetical protein